MIAQECIAEFPAFYFIKQWKPHAAWRPRNQETRFDLWAQKIERLNNTSLHSVQSDSAEDYQYARTYGGSRCLTNRHPLLAIRRVHSMGRRGFHFTVEPNLFKTHL